MTPKQHATIAERCQKALIDHTAAVIDAERAQCLNIAEAWLARVTADETITAVAALAAIVAEISARKSFD